MRKALLSLLAAACLAAPAHAESEMDPTVMVISDDCKAAFEFYELQYRPLIFARSRDGRLCTYNYCTAACKSTDTRARVLWRCQRESGGAPCRVVAVFGKPVEGAPDLLDGQ